MATIKETELIEETSSAVNILQKAQERRQKRETHLFLDVPTWDGDLVAEYRILDPDEMKAMAEKSIARARNGAEPGANDIALIMATHVGLHVLDRETGERVAITDDFGHVGYGRIAKFLGKELVLRNTVDSIKYLMSERDPDNSDSYIVNLIAISLHSQSIQRWMRDPSKRTLDLEDLLGEL